MGINGIGIAYYQNHILTNEGGNGRTGTGYPTKREAADLRYTDAKTGISWYVSDGKRLYMIGEDVAKLKELCRETGEPWLKKFAEMTGTIQQLDDNTTAFVGTNGTAVKSKDGKELFVDTSSLSYDMIMYMFRNLSGGGNYFDSGYWHENIRKAMGMVSF